MMFKYNRSQSRTFQRNIYRSQTACLGMPCNPFRETLRRSCSRLPWHLHLVVSSLFIPCLFIVKGDFPSAQRDTGFNCFLLGCSSPVFCFVWLSQAGFASGENIYQEHLFILFTQGGPLCTFWGTFGLSSWDPWKICICVLLMPHTEFCEKL